MAKWQRVTADEPIRVDVQQGIECLMHLDMFPVPDGVLGVATDISPFADYVGLFCAVAMVPFMLYNHVEQPSDRMKYLLLPAKQLFDAAQKWLEEHQAEEDE